MREPVEFSMEEYQDEAAIEYNKYLEGASAEALADLKLQEERYAGFVQDQYDDACENPDRFKGVSIDVPAELLGEVGLESLPKGVGVKGGAARWLLAQTIGTSDVAAPRDIDLLFDESQIDAENNIGYIASLLESYMPDDYEHTGTALIGMCMFAGPFEHFSTQDFTMNEVYYLDGQIHATQRCIDDFRAGTIRVTEYEKSYMNGSVGPKMMMKALRFWARTVSEGQDKQVAEYEKLDFGYVPTFWLYINLKKAFEEGREVAEAFWGKIIRHALELNDYEEGWGLTYQELFEACGDDPSKVFIYLTLELDNLSDDGAEIITALGEQKGSLDRMSQVDHILRELRKPQGEVLSIVSGKEGRQVDPIMLPAIHSPYYDPEENDEVELGEGLPYLLRVIVS